jgi:hypothetical protein
MGEFLTYWLQLAKVVALSMLQGRRILLVDSAAYVLLRAHSEKVSTERTNILVLGKKRTDREFHFFLFSFSLIRSLLLFY